MSFGKGSFLWVVAAVVVGVILAEMVSARLPIPGRAA